MDGIDDQIELHIRKECGEDYVDAWPSGKQRSDTDIEVVQIDGRSYMHVVVDDRWPAWSRTRQGQWTFERSPALDQPRAERLYKAFMESLILGGHVAEFGVFTGVTAKAIAHYLKEHQSSKRLHLFDTFEGLPPGSLADSTSGDVQRFNRNHQGQYLSSLKDVQGHLVGMLDLTVFHQGVIAATGPSFDQPLCFAHIDCDLYQGTADALAVCDRLLVPGGMVIVDDYNTHWTGVKVAVDEWFNGDIWQMSVTTGSCLLRKKMVDEWRADTQ